MDKSHKKMFVRGAAEVDLVYSGLQDTMEVACANVAAMAHSNKVDYRTGALMSAIYKLATVHKHAGLFL
jgi:glutamate dehydrogenase (NAD(P)+)